MHQIARREGIGAIFAESLRRAMDALEGELPDELIRLGRALEFGFGFSAHREGRLWDYEPLPFWAISALMYASESRDPTIGTHQSALLHANFVEHDAALAARRFRRALGAGVRLPRRLRADVRPQDADHDLDSAPAHPRGLAAALRLRVPDADPAARRLRGLGDGGERPGRPRPRTRVFCGAVTGVEYSQEDLDRVAERAFTLERVMLARAGRSRPMEHALVGHFKRPCRDDGTVLDEAGFARMLDEYYAARGWDRERGWPEAATLEPGWGWRKPSPR